MPILSNQRHERFAQEIAQGKSAAEAYCLAGYRAADKSAETAGPRLFRNVQIQQRVIELQQKVARKAEITLESLLEEAELQRAAAFGAEQYAAANSALKLKAELSGHYVLRKQDVTPRRSEAEIDARLRELLAGGDQAGSSGTAGTAPKLRSPSQLN
jgi:phage terminase small subunit